MTAPNDLTRLHELPRTDGDHPLASLTVALGLPLLVLAGILSGFQPVARRAAVHEEVGGPSGAPASGGGPAPVVAVIGDAKETGKWTPEMTAMKERLDAAERRSQMLEAQTDRILEDLRKARETGRQARQELAETEIQHRERLEGFALQVAGMTQRIADARDTETLLRGELVLANGRGDAMAALAEERGGEIARFKRELAALAEIGRNSQTRLVATGKEADARKREAAGLARELSAVEAQLAKARGEGQGVRALADQRLVQIGRLEAEKAELSAELAGRDLASRQALSRRDQRIAALERALAESQARTERPSSAGAITPLP